jgi:hypothetical protein
MRKEQVASDVNADNYALCSQEEERGNRCAATLPLFYQQYSKIKHTEV